VTAVVRRLTRIVAQHASCRTSRGTRGLTKRPRIELNELTSGRHRRVANRPAKRLWPTWGVIRLSPHPAQADPNIERRSHLDPKESAVITAFNNHLIRFIQALDEVHRNWHDAATKAQQGKVASCFVKRAINTTLKYRDIAFEARNEIRSIAPCIVVSIPPPSGQSPQQFVVSILDDVEKSWHLCRFVHCINPNEQLENPNLACLPEQMYLEMPILRNRLWESQRHIFHVIELAHAPPKNKRSRSGRPKADDQTIKREAKLAAEWNQARESGTSKIDFVKDRGLKLKDFETTLSRVRKRKTRADK